MKQLYVFFIGISLIRLGTVSAQSIIDTRKDNVQEIFPLMINAGVKHIVIKDTIKHFNMEFLNSKKVFIDILDLSEATIGAKKYKLIGKAYSIKEKKSYEPDNREVTMEPENKLRSLSFSNLRFKKIFLPNNLETIGSSIGWHSLTEIPIFPNSLKVIESTAFSRCSQMSGNIVLPPNIEVIGNGAFSGCALLTGIVKIPLSLDLMRSSGCFNGCVGLDGVSISKDAQCIFKDGFILTRDKRTILSSSIPARVSIQLPKTVSTVYHSALSYDMIVEEIICHMGIKIIGDWAFSSCRNLRKINLPEGLEEIGQESFYECAISKLEIPSTVKRIKSNRWSGVDTIILQSPHPCVLEEIGNPRKELIVIVPKGAKAAYEQAEGWKNYRIIEQNR